jgi:hypothetical protein
VRNAVPTPTGFTDATEEYDGATWTSGGNLSVARANLAAAGTQTAGLSFGGYDGLPDRTDSTEEYDGSTWSPGGNLSTARQELGGCWNSNSCFSFWW